jgi:Uma2 family endonuclease
MADPSRRRATYEDVLAAPEHMTAEVIDGELHLQAKPRRRHVRAASSLGASLVGSFDFGANGPGGWVILHEPELHLRADIVVADLAGWREDQYPGDVDDDDPYFTAAPQWVCEILSDSTARFDRVKKVPTYARERVGHVWLVDPRDRVVEGLRLEGARYVLLGPFGDDEGPFALEPFEAVPLSAAALWGRRLGQRGGAAP